MIHPCIAARCAPSQAEILIPLLNLNLTISSIAIFSFSASSKARVIQSMMQQTKYEFDVRTCRDIAVMFGTKS